MANSRANDFMGYGTHSARPATPSINFVGTPVPIAFYYETDTLKLFTWDNSTTSWLLVPGLTGMTNGQLLIGSTGAASVPATITAGTGISVTNSAGGITIANTGGGGGGNFAGLFSSVQSIPVPTSSGTGFTTWVNQGGASVADFDDGIRLTAPAGSGDSLRLRSQNVPATPYTKKAIISLEASMQDYQAAFIGWSDGTKFQMFGITMNDDAGSQINWNVQQYATTTSFNANTITGQFIFDPKAYVELSDDGTNITIKAARFGVPNLTTLYTVAKASGYLGSGGYTKLVWGANRNNTHGSSSAIANLHYFA